MATGRVAAGVPNRNACECGYACGRVVVDELNTAADVVEVVEETPGYVVGVLGRMVLLRTREPFQPEAAQALFDATTRVMEIHGPRLVYVVMPGAKQPSVSAEARAGIAAVWPKIQAQSVAGAVWIRSRSFNTVLHRNQLAELLPHLRHRSLLGVTETAAETIAFFHDNVTDFDVDPAFWTSALDAFGRRFD